MATVTSEDDDLKALRAASWALKELKRVIPQYIPQPDSGAKDKQVPTLSAIDVQTMTELVYCSLSPAFNLLQS
jgi:hypothetical protein